MVARRGKSIIVSSPGDWMVSVRLTWHGTVWKWDVNKDIVDRVRRRCRMDTVWCLLGLEVIWMRPVGGGAKVSYDQRRQWEKRYKRMKQGGAA